MTTYIVMAYCFKGRRTLKIEADDLAGASKKAKAKIDEPYSRFHIREAYTK